MTVEELYGNRTVQWTATALLAVTGCKKDLAPIALQRRAGLREKQGRVGPRDCLSCHPHEATSSSIVKTHGGDDLCIRNGIPSTNVALLFSSNATQGRPNYHKAVGPQPLCVCSAVTYILTSPG